MMLEFEVIQQEDGSFVAACFDKRIYAEGRNIQELYDNMNEAIEEHYGDKPKPKASDIKLVLYRVEVEKESMKVVG